jgi:cysteine-rich repeat protein
MNKSLLLFVVSLIIVCFSGYALAVNPVIDGKFDGSLYGMPVLKCDSVNLGGMLIGYLYTSTAANGDVSVYYEQVKNLNDNSYGTTRVNWSRNHNFGDLTGSDKARFVFKNKNGNIVMDFYVDYMTASATFPSGYGSLGVSGGEGKMNIGSAANVLGATTSLSYDFNSLGYILTVNSPPTISSSSYTLPVGSPYTGWLFENAYETKVAAAAFGASGFGSVEVTSVHNSPPKTGKNEALPSSCTTQCIDNDQDGYSPTGGICGPVDCNDMNANVHPGATEICNGIDDDCDGLIDEGCAGVCGNGNLESGEQCDDGNNNNNDGCSSACQLEACPDMVIASANAQLNDTVKKITSSWDLGTNNCPFNTQMYVFVVDNNVNVIGSWSGAASSGSAVIDISSGYPLNYPLDVLYFLYCPGYPTCVQPGTGDLSEPDAENHIGQEGVIPEFSSGLVTAITIFLIAIGGYLITTYYNKK